MRFKQDGNIFILRLEPGEEIMSSIIEFCKEHVHSRGIRDELAPGVVALRTIWGLARREPYFSDPSPMNIDFDEHADDTLRPVVQLLVTSLNRLFLGTRPYWGTENAALHCTWLEKPAHKVLRAFPAPSTSW